MNIEVLYHRFGLGMKGATLKGSYCVFDLPWGVNVCELENHFKIVFVMIVLLLWLSYVSLIVSLL